MDLSIVLGLVQNPYVIGAYVGGFVISLAALVFLFNCLGEMKTKDYVYAILGALIFPLSLLVLFLFSSGVAVSHTIKVLLGRNA